MEKKYSTNPETQRRSEWDAMPPEVQTVHLKAMQRELLRLHDCVETWLPAMERLSSSMYAVRVDVGRELRGIPTPVDSRVVDKAKEQLRELSD